MADFTIKANDNLPSIQATLTDADGPVNLTTASAVSFIMRIESGGPVKVNSPAVIVDLPTDGVVRYDWLAVDTDAPGLYHAEWQVTWGDGKKQTFPTLTYHTVEVRADLDGA